MKVSVVTVYERVACHSDEVDAMVFSSHEKAEAWIEEQIDSYVKSFALDRETAIDGFEINFDEEQRTIKYNIVEREVV